MPAINDEKTTGIINTMPLKYVMVLQCASLKNKVKAVLSDDFPSGFMCGKQDTGFGVVNTFNTTEPPQNTVKIFQ